MAFRLYLDAKGAAQLTALVEKALEKSPTLLRLVCKPLDYDLPELPERGTEVGRITCSNPSQYPKLAGYDMGKTKLAVRSHNVHVEAYGGYDIQVSLEIRAAARASQRLPAQSVCLRAGVFPGSPIHGPLPGGSARGERAAPANHVIRAAVASGAASPGDPAEPARSR